MAFVELAPALGDTVSKCRTVTVQSRPLPAKNSRFARTAEAIQLQERSCHFRFIARGDRSANVVHDYQRHFAQDGPRYVVKSDVRSPVDERMQAFFRILISIRHHVSIHSQLMLAQASVMTPPR